MLSLLAILLGASCTTTEPEPAKKEDSYVFPSKDKERDVHKLVREGNFKEIVHAFAWDRECINKLDADGRTPLDLALLDNDAVTYVKMRKMGAVTTSLHFEAHEKNLAQFTWIAENRPKTINRADSSGQYPLHRAARLQEPRFARVLLKKGAKADVIDADGKTALHYAAMHGNVAVLAALLDRSADPNVVDYDQKRPLDYALERGDDLKSKNCQTLLRRAGGVRSP